MADTDPNFTPDAPAASAPPDPNFTPDAPADPNFTPDAPAASAPAAPEPDVSNLTKYTRANIDAHVESLKPQPDANGNMPKVDPNAPVQPIPKPVDSFMDALDAGWQMSTSGLVKRGQMPDKVLPQDAGWAMKMMSMSGTLMGDIGAMGAGMIAGGEGGAALGALGGPGGAIVGGAVGAAYGAWAAPAGLRSALIQHYQKGDIKDPTDFLQRAGAVFIDQLKAGTTGAAAELTGGVAGGFAKFAGAAPLSVTVSNLSAQVAAMTTVGKAMEGHMPKWQDFRDSALMLGLFHGLSSAAGIATSAFPGNGAEGAPAAAEGAPALPAPEGPTNFPGAPKTLPLYSPEFNPAPAEVVPQGTEAHPDSPHGQMIIDKLHNVYAQTGLRPEQVVEDANADPALKQELLSENVKFPTKYQPLIEPPQKGQEVFGEQPKTIEMGSNSEWNRMHPALSPDFTNERGFQVPEETAPAGGGGNEPPSEPPALPPESQAIRDRWQSTIPAKKRGITFDDAITALTDNTHPIKQLQDALNGKRPALLESENPQTQMRRSRGAFEAADNAIKQGPRDFNTYRVGQTRGLEDIFNDAKDVPAFNDYLAADLAVKLAPRGIKTNIPLEQAKAVVANGKAQFGDLAQEAYDFRNGILKYYADSGYLSKSELNAMLANADRVGAYRIQEEGGKGGGPTSKTVKGIKGSEKRIIAPSESLVKETYARIRAAEQNRVTTLLSNLYEANWENVPDGVDVGKEFPTRKNGEVTQVNRSIGMKQVETQMRPVNISAEEIQKYLDKHEIDGTAEDDLTTFRPQYRPLGQNEIENYRDGNREVFEVSKEVADVIKRIDPGSANIISKILKPPAKALSVGATHNPFFLLKHWLRQEIMAGIISQNNYAPFLHAVVGTYHILANTETAQYAAASGALQGAITDVNKDYIKNSIFDLSKKTGLLDRQQNVVSTPKELAIISAKLLHSLVSPIERGMTNASSIVFNSTKVAEFANVTKGDFSPESLAKGAIAARNVSYDSSKVGAQVRAVNGMIAFWHPRMQGVEQLGSAIKRDAVAAKNMAVNAFAAAQGKEPPIDTSNDQPFATTLKMAGMAAIGALLWWANRDDPRRKAGTRSEQDLYWRVMTDDWQPVPQGRIITPDDYTRIGPNGEQQLNMGNVYKISKPFEAGIISSSLLERTLDYLYDKDPQAFKGFGESIMHGMMPDTLLTALVPAIEKASNKSILTGSTIIPHNLEKVLPSDQYTNYTSETAKVLGKYIANLSPPGEGLNTPGSWASPMIIDNTVRAWTGEMGHYFTALIDQAMYKSGMVPEPERATPTLADNIFFHSFVSRYPSMGHRQVQDFFDNFETMSALHDTAKAKIGHDDIMGAMQLRQSEAQMGDLKEARTAIIAQMNAIRNIDRMPNVTPNDKRQMEDGLIMVAIGIAKQKNAQMETLKNSMK